jgi:small GTP-binding protein
MIKKKICMLGSYAVGKTSLVGQFVNGIFSEKYHTTIGVKIDQKTIAIDDTEVKLLLWDIHGEDEFQKVKASYLTGASGVILVIDGTRKNTQETVTLLHQTVVQAIGNVPEVLLVNKNDLRDEWEFDEKSIEQLAEMYDDVYLTSAKTGENVETAFRELTKRMIKN